MYNLHKRGDTMKSVEINDRKRYRDTVIAIAEGVWNGIVVSGVMTISALLIERFWIF